MPKDTHKKKSKLPKSVREIMSGIPVPTHLQGISFSESTMEGAEGHDEEIYGPRPPPATEPTAPTTQNPSHIPLPTSLPFKINIPPKKDWTYYAAEAGLEITDEVRHYMNNFAKTVPEIWTGKEWDCFMSGFREGMNMTAGYDLKMAAEEFKGATHTMTSNTTKLETIGTGLESFAGTLPEFTDKLALKVVQKVQESLIAATHENPNVQTVIHKHPGINWHHYINHRAVVNNILAHHSKFMTKPTPEVHEALAGIMKDLHRNV